MGNIISGAAKAIGGGGKGGGKGGGAGGGAMDLVSKLASAVTGGKGKKGAEAGGGSDKAKKSAKKQKKKEAQKAKKAQEAQKAQQVNKTATPQIAQGPANVPGSSLNQFFSASVHDPNVGGPDLISGLNKNFGV